MKCVFTSLALFFFTVANAQHPSEKNQNDFLQKLNGNQFRDVKITGDSLVLLNNSYAFNQYNMKYLFENNRGKVYESYIDHMHILAPNFNSNMPVLKSDIHSLHSIKPVPIPNPIPKVEIIRVPYR